MVYASQPLYGPPGAPMSSSPAGVIRIVPLYWLVTTRLSAGGDALPGFGEGTRRATSSSRAICSSPVPRPDGSCSRWSDRDGRSITKCCSTRSSRSRCSAPQDGRDRLALSLAGGRPAIGISGSRSSSPRSFWTNPIISNSSSGCCSASPTWKASGCRAGSDGRFCRRPRDVPGKLADAHTARARRLLRCGASGRGRRRGSDARRPPASGALWSGFVLIGEASYALYLTHAIAVRGLIALSAASASTCRSGRPVLASALGRARDRGLLRVRAAGHPPLRNAAHDPRQAKIHRKPW